MPFALPAPSLIPSNLRGKSSKFQHYRSRSTTYQDATTPANEHVSAILHGEKPKGKPSQQSTAQLKQFNHSAPSPHKPMTSAQQAQKRSQSKRESHVAHGKKRKAQEPLHSSASRRRRKNVTVHGKPDLFKTSLPTRQQHKDLPTKLFSEPKNVLCSISQGIFTFSSDFAGSIEGGAQCKLTCSFNDGRENRTTEANGPNMVCLIA